MVTLCKIIISPFIFLGYCALMLAGMIFPVPLIMMLSFFLAVQCIGVAILNPVLKNKISVDDPIIEFFKSNFLNHLLGMTILFWVPFYAVYHFWTEGELLMRD